MIYTIKNHPTFYRGTLFRSRLEARYAAYFDLCDFRWDYEPVDFEGWTPDFKVNVPCGHSQCPDEHPFWVEIKPYDDVAQFKGHAAERFNEPYVFPAVGLGLNPLIETETEFCHGAGGGVETLSRWVERNGISPAPDDYIRDLWAEAGNRTRFLPGERN